ncbi:hypothetical protein JOF28_000307 [Leucobacter exalbidus]|uniref:Uncharacterized protein n=1 Tax=Leucobacter exalbidus TaxID=662960 RepID=A0A940PL00_9MICO|nr:hypothetical protein [Leucobacter exalbidus]MBP1325075.1 hypothetical protein [Leucobacter exalbidus]
MSNSEQSPLATISNSDPGRLVHHWGPFSYYEGFNSVDIVRNGGEDAGSTRISLTGDGFVEIVTSSGRKLYVNEAGAVTVWRKQSEGEICIDTDDSVTFESGDGTTDTVINPDGSIELREQDADLILLSLPLKTKGLQLDWIWLQAEHGVEVAVKQLMDRANISERVATRRMRQARKYGPESFEAPIWGPERAQAS